MEDDDIKKGEDGYKELCELERGILEYWPKSHTFKVLSSDAKMVELLKRHLNESIYVLSERCRFCGSEKEWVSINGGLSSYGGKLILMCTVCEKYKEMEDAKILVDEHNETFLAYG